MKSWLISEKIASLPQANFEKSTRAVRGHKTILFFAETLYAIPLANKTCADKF